jgi:TRAP-type C4-dicarboxylate transport system substrate-binding protein
MAAQKLRWLIAHQPAYLFVRTAEAFASELEKALPGQFEIEVLTMKQYIQTYGDVPGMELKVGSIPGIEEGKRFKDTESSVFKKIEWAENKQKWTAVFNAMKEGKFQLSQTQVTVIGGQLSQSAALLDLPFLFDNHDHVSAVLDNEIGDEICEKMGKESGIKGLAFTYSGGYRIIGSNHEIGSLDELKTVDITTVPLTRFFFNKFANKATSRFAQTIDEIAQSAANGGAIETTYLRFSGKNVLKTNHSMFLTSILIGQDFFDALTPEQQVAFSKAAKIVAKLERQWSLDDAAKYEAEAIENGVTIKEVTAEETEQMRGLAVEQYKVAYDYLGDGAEELVNRIKARK